MTRSRRMRRRRMLHAYRLGLKHGLAHFKLDEMRVGLERELVLLRGEIVKLRAEYSRAQEIGRALEVSESGVRLH
jgi:hypothetical protein